jgi:chaperonin cofactor prefoldin
MQEFGQKELDELLNYVKHLEGQVEDLKATAMTLVQQRNAAMSKLKEITSKLHKPLIESSTLDVDFTLENPEQYKQIIQF